MNKNNESSSLAKDWKLINFCEFDKYATQSYCAIHGTDESLNLGDITKVDETKLEPFNMICGGSPCFVKGTKVLTDNGYKNIEDIKVGDMVLTYKNRYMPVVNIGGEHNKDIYSLRVQGFLKTECTDYHPFYCKRNKNSKPEKIKLKDIKKGYYIGSHINNESINDFNLSNEDCWILGRYVADGHIRKEKRKGRIDSYHYQCILSIGNNKVNELKEIIKEHNFSCFPHTESVHRVVFSSMELVNFILDNEFGRNAESKKIPQFILNLPVDKLQSFLNGYMSGDGCEIDGKYQATTVSKELAMSLCLAIQKVYRVGCRIYFDERPNTHEIQGRVVNQKDTYMIRFMKESQKQAWFIEDNIVWYPVKEITDLNKQEDVYNIEVKEDHTYTANNMIVYNCQDFSVAGKQKGSVWTCKDCGHEYNPLTVHWSERDKCPNCHSENIKKTRSSLLVEYLRVIRANKPNFGMYENVKNIVGKQFKDTFKMFTDELDEYGYNVYWKVLNAKDYGVPQNRERVYLIFIKKELDNGKFVFPEGFDNGIRLRDVLEDDVDDRYYISNDKVEKFLEQLFSNIEKKSEKNDNTPIRLGNVYGEQFGTGYAGNVWDTNAISPALMTMQGGGRQPHIMCGIDKSLNRTKFIDNANCLTAREDRGISNRKSEGTAVIEVLGNLNPSGKGMNGNVFSDNGLSPTLTTNKGEGSKILTCVNPMPDGTCRTLKAQYYKTSLANYQREGSMGATGVTNGIAIRKLTPKECFRLMGFNDSDYEAASKVVSNSQMYKQTGNSIVVDVLYYILVELYKAMPYLFDDLRLSSFFSGIGAFECSLNLLYQRNINFDRSELNIKECEICGSSLRVKHNKTTHMFLCEKHCKQIYKYGEITDSSSYNQNDKNEIKLYEDYAMLILKNKHGKTVGESIIDLDDVGLISQYKWTIGNHGYVTSGSGKNQILLHRLLSNAPNNVYVDHINRNKLDNRKLNYRFCTNQENNRNKDLYAHNSSGITGVTWNKERNKWQAQIVVNDKNISLGRYEVFDDAVNARLNAEEKYFKDFMPENRNGLYESINTGNFTNPQVE